MNVYICDQNKECSSSCGCMKNGGECSKTTDLKHAMKFEQCTNCYYKGDVNDPRCQKCEDTDPEDHILPPTKWKYEDPEGEWK